MSGISTSEDRRKERTRAPPNFWEGDTGSPACETFLNGLKAGMGREAGAPPIVWEGERGTGDPAYVRHLWIYNMSARIGGRRGHVPLPTFKRGAQMALPVLDISEWIQIEGQGRRGYMLLLTLIKGHRSVCISRDMADIPLKQRKSSIQPTNQPTNRYLNAHLKSVFVDKG